MEKELYFEDGYTFIELKNDVGMELTLSTYGAGLYSCKVFGKSMNVTPLSKKDYAENLAYYGKTVGRIAGRIKDGVLHYEGKDYPLSKNEKGKKTLHGGEKGYSYREWGYIEKEDEEAHYVCFYLDSPDLDNGFPHAVKLGVVYVLFKHKNEFQIQMFAEAEHPTPVSLTNHTYWNLGEKDILDAKLYVRMKKVESYDADLLPAGYVDPIPSLDFSSPKLLRDSLNDPVLANGPTGGVDHNFLFDGASSRVPSIILENGNKRMEIFTTFPSAQLYSDNFAADVVMEDGEKDKRFSSLAIEPQLTPDIEKMIVVPGTPFAHLIDYRFYQKGE